MNANQLNQIIEVLNTKSKSISEFFGSDEFREISVDVKPIIGRSFQCRYENNKVTAVIDEEFKKRLSPENISLFVKLIESLSGALSEVLEQEDEKELILDVFNQKLTRQL